MMSTVSLNDVISKLSDDDVLRIVREKDLTIQLPISVLDRLNITLILDEIVRAARERVRLEVVVSLA